MHRFTEFHPQIAEAKFGSEPSLHEYMDAWLQMEQADNARVMDEVRAVLQEMDALAFTWGDEGRFRRCRDRLRNLLRP